MSAAIVPGDDGLPRLGSAYREAVMRVVIAPDSFKGSIGAAAAAAAIAAGWASVRPSDELVLLPQADGGEGSLDALEAATPGNERVPVGPVTGPDGRPVPGEWLSLPDGTAVIEMALVSGLPLMAAPDALGATSRGLGEVMAHAIDAGARRLLVGIGGSASTDGGIPVLEALGDRKPPAGGVVVLTDVTNPLLGRNGAAAVFGPQKGATAQDVEVLERRLQGVAEQLGADPATPGAGAAGGVGYALHAWGAELTSGSAHIAEVTGLTDAEIQASAVVTGEGRFDSQSLQGKVVGGVLGRATSPVVLIAGSIQGDPGIPAWSLSDMAGGTAAALEQPAHWLFAAGAEAAAAVRDERAPTA